MSEWCALDWFHVQPKKNEKKSEQVHFSSFAKYLTNSWRWRCEKSTASLLKRHVLIIKRYTSNSWRRSRVAKQTPCRFIFEFSLCCVLGGRRFGAHRLMLSAASDYFAAMFTSNLREATQEEIEMHDVDPDALWDLILFCYTGTVLFPAYTRFAQRNI
jgi:hypothetical protein